ncbi:hypothetical protein T265_09945 [Opisthorchis viverrini]|uniref:Uncharacterized protein n=1 Tax=Opisthorchis viverrini TaxID=6198 RepID=A0A075A340_OPIVI|nr:hypothetical protein T265_09945 [Opisthorchis viverrini]KER21809.1 hypothetical protein T265_09945 [Opisthorchis viverrini]
MVPYSLVPAYLHDKDIQFSAEKHTSCEYESSAQMIRIRQKYMHPLRYWLTFGRHVGSECMHPVGFLAKLQLLLFAHGAVLQDSPSQFECPANQTGPRYEYGSMTQKGPVKLRTNRLRNRQTSRFGS